jgi:hypothetical protein
MPKPPETNYTRWFASADWNEVIRPYAQYQYDVIVDNLKVPTLNAEQRQELCARLRAWDEIINCPEYVLARKAREEEIAENGRNRDTDIPSRTGSPPRRWFAPAGRG